MFSRLVTQQAQRALVKKTAFQQARGVASYHFKDGVYTNLPFKVHNRRIPYAVPHFLFFFLGFAVPGLAVGVQLARAGCFDAKPEESDD